MPIWSGAQPGLGDGAAEQPGLGGTAGRSQPGASAVLVDGAGPHLGEDPPAVPQGGRFTLQHEHRRSLGPHGSAGLRAVGAAVAVVGQRMLFGELDEEAR